VGSLAAKKSRKNTEAQRETSAHRHTTTLEFDSTVAKAIQRHFLVVRLSLIASAAHRSRVRWFGGKTCMLSNNININCLQQVDCFSYSTPLVAASDMSSSFENVPNVPSQIRTGCFSPLVAPRIHSRIFILFRAVVCLKLLDDSISNFSRAPRSYSEAAGFGLGYGYSSLLYHYRRC
jgi:hypothetical protein